MTPDEFELAAAGQAAEQAFDHLCRAHGNDPEVIRGYLADLLAADTARIQRQLVGDTGPVVVGSYRRGYGCDAGEFPAWAVFTTRALADAAIAEYDAAVRRAEAAGMSGICHVGDLVIAPADEIPTDPPSFRPMVGDNLYLLRYWPEDDTP